MIPATAVEEAVAALFVKANYTLTEDVTACIACAAADERCALAKSVLHRLLDNVEAAREMDVPICQDTGMAVVFLYIGEDAHILGNVTEAVNRGVHRAYTEGALRLSVVSDPLYARVNTEDNTPAVLHIRAVSGDRVRIVALPKGFGSENKSALRMFTPAATEEDIVRFVVETVERAGADPCPPISIGVGIGSDFEGCAVLAKECFTRRAGEHNADARYAALEARLLDAVNATGIGPQGFSGDTTALSVAVEAAPTHIAGLPVAVNINCHVLRHAEVEL